MYEILTSRDDDEEQQDDDTNDQADAHLHVFPPHLLPHTIGASSESLCRDCQIVCLVL